MEQLTIDKISVLLVEPSKAQKMVIEQAMQKSGVVNIEWAKSGAQALEEAKRYPPDLVTSSLYLPDMTGAELLEALRSDADTEATPFILISSETKFRALDPVKQAGAMAILPKPFSQEQMNQAIYATIDTLDPHSLPPSDVEIEALNVLLVDDSTFSREHMRRLLESIGVERITEAVDGQQAINDLEGKRYDLVISDYNMPHIDGQQLTDYIRQSTEQSMTPILMVTSEENQERLAALHSSGVSAICNKPFDLKNFRDMIEQVVG